MIPPTTSGNTPTTASDYVNRNDDPPRGEPDVHSLTASTPTSATALDFMHRNLEPRSHLPSDDATELSLLPAVRDVDGGGDSSTNHQPRLPDGPPRYSEPNFNNWNTELWLTCNIVTIPVWHTEPPFCGAILLDDHDVSPTSDPFFTFS